MKREFYIGIGIENCWMVQEDRPGIRPLDVFQQMGHYDRWQEDLALVKDLGVNAIRYSVPWYRANPSPGEYDWDWIAKPLDWLVANGITPVIDLIHYGTPAWMANGILDNRFPERFAEYAHAFARRFDGVADHYTPMNEPQAGVGKSGIRAEWPPYLHGPDGWATLCRPLARAMVLASRALRDACSSCVLISAECTPPGAVEALAEATGTAGRGLGSTMLHLMFPASLAYGTILPGDPLVEALGHVGYGDSEFQWFRDHAEPPDILGCNYYPNMETTAPGEAREKLFATLGEVHAAFGLPVYVTETSSGLDDEKKCWWVRALGELREQARAQGLPLCGINWWPLYETIQWNYRENGKPVEECIVPGGWNNGLYVIDKAPGASLARVPTAAVAEFRKLCGDVLR